MPKEKLACILQVYCIIKDLNYACIDKLDFIVENAIELFM